MFPPIPCWSDGFAVTFHYADLSVVYYKDPQTGKVTPFPRIPRENLTRVVLWNDRHPLLEVHVNVDQRPIFVRLENDDGSAKAYLVGWQQRIGDQSIQSIGYYIPPGFAMPGRIIISGEYEQTAVDKFLVPDFRDKPVNCWPDSTTYSFYYQDGTRIDRLNKETGEEYHSDKLSRAGLRKIALWHHEVPVIECHYHPGQLAVFRRRSEWLENVASDINSASGIPLAGLMASTHWFAHKRAVEENRYRVLYLLGWQQPIAGKSVQSIAYYHPQNGEMPPKVVMAGRFSGDEDSYLPELNNEDNTLIT
jgi:hypothetical protein